MVSFGGYDLSEATHTTASCTLHKARHTATGEAVILKVLAADVPSPTQVARIRHEYSLLDRIRHPNVIRSRGVVRHGSKVALVLEDFGGQSLTEDVPSTLAVADVLHIGHAVAEALTAVHRARIIHKDVNPGNIVWNPHTGAVRLIDFGISSELEREQASYSPTGTMEGTLPYIAPEQTGRMNRVIDSRSDLYSLGATLFTLATGQAPFPSDDPLDVLHGHLARRPPRLRTLVPEAPAALEEIIDRLLAKAAEDRYQTAAGLAADLQRCAQRLAAGVGDVFPLGADDISDRFDLPQRLYGRDAERAALLGAFDRVAVGGREWVLVAGYSGIGKSSLVHEIHRPIGERRGLFTAGKFDQFQRDVPYAPLLHAFRTLVTGLLSESPEHLAEVRTRLAAAVGSNGAVIADVIPEVCLVLGPQEPVAELDPPEAMNRFLHVFEEFVSAFASPDQPLVLFLDDLQWADLPSLQLLCRLLMDTPTSHLLVIGAFRDNEVGEGHPLRRAEERVRRHGTAVRRIELGPLGEADVRLWLAEALSRPATEVTPLATRCLHQTGGNPFFLNQFLLALVDRGGIRFEAGARRWVWDDATIARLGITANVVELMAGRIQTLEPRVQDAVVGAALLGAEFDLETLSIALDTTALVAAARLEPAVREGLLLPRGNAWQFLGDMEDAATLGSNEPQGIRYGFLHDRVQQAAYALIAEDARAGRHLAIARRLVLRLDERAQNERVFDLLTHGTPALPLMTDPAERRHWLDRYLFAGRRAIASAAFGAAVTYLKTAIDIGGAGLWEHEHPLALEIHALATQAAYQSGDFQRMEQFATAYEAHARTALERARLAEVRVQALIGQNRLVEAVDGALAMLADLGVTFPADPQPADVMAAIGATAAAVGERSAHELLESDEMRDPEKRAALRMLQKITSATYVARPALFPLVPMMGVQLSATLGNTGASTYAYACYGIILAGVVGDVPRAAEMGTLAVRLVDRYRAREFEARTRYIDACYIRHWCRHAFETWEAFPAIYEVGLETGDLEFAGWALFMGAAHAFFSGRPLVESEAESARWVPAIGLVKQETALQYARATLQCVRALLGSTPDPKSLRSEGYEDEALLAKHVEARDAFGVANLLLMRVVLRALHGDPAGARAAMAELDPWFPSMVATIHVPMVLWLDAWTAIAVSQSATESERGALLDRARGCREKLAAFAVHAPMNHAHKVLFVDGMLAKVSGDLRLARMRLRESVEAAAGGENLWAEALALQELGALWWSDEGETEVGERVLRRAHQCWALWGARRVAEQLVETYGARVDSRAHAVDAGPSPRAKALSISKVATMQARSDEFDFLAILRANQALSAEVRLDALLKTLMRLALEAGGAVYGALLLGDGKDSRLVAVDCADDDRAADRFDVAIDDAVKAGTLPGAICHYVLRTRQPLVVEDAARDPRFARDPYVKSKELRSVLVQPLQHQGRWLGLIYLENGLATGAFTPDRAQGLTLLCGQAAVAVQNASLFARQQMLVESFSRFVPKPFLQHLGRSDVADIQLGDSVKARVAVLFSDLRDFTTMSEGLRPEENFAVLNQYLARMVPEIEQRGGFVDKYIGDAIMALFPGSPATAVEAAVGMHRALDALNADRAKIGAPPLQMGVGVHVGEVMLGTVGAGSRMDTTVIGDAVNLASRIEGLTKIYKTRLLVSRSAMAGVDPQIASRDVGKVRVKGKLDAIEVVEVLDAWGPAERASRHLRAQAFDRARNLYFDGDLPAAQQLLRDLRSADPEDGVVAYYHDRAAAVISGEGTLTAALGVEVVDLK